MKTKEKLKQIKYRIESLFFIIQRTLLSSFCNKNTIKI